MADSDDWENDLENDETDDTKKKVFEDEDKNVKTQKQIEEEKAAERKAAQEKANAEARQKDNKKVDLDKKFEEKQKRLGKVVDTTGLKGQQLEQALESNQVDDLLGDDEDASGAVQKKVYLNSEADYKKFGKDTADILYKGPTPYRVEHFFKELTNDLPNHCDSKQIKNIVNHLQTIFNAKQAAEKAKETKGKKAKKPQVNMGVAGLNKEKNMNNYEHNNNPAMIAENMGFDENDEYGDEYGNEGTGFKKEGEADYDFM